MIPIIGAGFLALILSLFGTPLFIKLLVRRGYGQFIRDDGPTSHHTKRGTPTMGGLVIIVAAALAYLFAHFIGNLGAPSVSAILVLFLVVGLGALGLADDYIKITRQRSLGLKAWHKLVGQFLIATAFAVLAVQFPDARGITPASFKISAIRDVDWLDLAFLGTAVGLVLFAIWANLMVAAWSNAVNLTDGLDGLATGISIIVLSAYVFITLWQSRQTCSDYGWNRWCYETRDPLDLAVLSAALVGACLGFLWWNTSPAKIFMGDTGSLALGGALAGLSIVTRTELLAVVLGGLFVIITLSVVIQVGFFKLSGGKRVFRMAPLQHHFELKGWAEVTIVVRFWIIAGLCVAVGVALFYAEWGVAALPGA